MIPGLFNNIQLSSNKLLRTADEAKNDAAEFYLTQLFPQTYTDIIDVQKSHMQQQQMQQQMPQSQLVYNPHSLIQLQQQQHPLNIMQPNTTTISTSDANNLYSPIATNVNGTSIQQQQQMTDYHPGVMAPQFVLDPTGQFLICQSAGWQ